MACQVGTNAYQTLSTAIVGRDGDSPRASSKYRRMELYSSTIVQVLGKMKNNQKQAGKPSIFVGPRIVLEVI